MVVHSFPSVHRSSRRRPELSFQRNLFRAVHAACDERTDGRTDGRRRQNDTHKARINTNSQERRQQRPPYSFQLGRVHLLARLSGFFSYTPSPSEGNVTVTQFLLRPTEMVRIVVMNMSVCLPLSARIYQKPHGRTSLYFLCMLLVAVARSYLALRYRYVMYVRFRKIFSRSTAPQCIPTRREYGVTTARVLASQAEAIVVL